MIVALAAGCGGATIVHHPPPGPGVIDIGTAALDGTGFLPLTGDQTLVPGSQGGFHIWIKYNLKNMGPGRLQVKRTARRVSDDRLLLTADGTVDVGAPGPDGFWDLPNAIPSFMCPSPLGVNIIGEPTVFDVVILDEAGNSLAEGSAEATPLCPTGDQAAFCQQICSG
jgi:hypothetical protein